MCDSVVLGLREHVMSVWNAHAFVFVLYSMWRLCLLCWCTSLNSVWHLPQELILLTRAFFYFSLLSQKKNISTEFCELGSQYKHLYIFFPLLSVICGQWKVTFIFILFFQSCQPQPIMRAGCSLPSLVESELSRMAVTNVERPPTVSQMKIITLQSPLTLFSLLTEGKVPAGPSNEKLHGEFEMERQRRKIRRVRVRENF